MSTSKKKTFCAFLVACCAMTGCVTYKPAPNPSMTKQDAIIAIDDLANQARNFRMYRTGLADERGFSYPMASQDQRLYRREYKDIDDVEVSVEFTGLIFLGILDPNALSAARITFKDTNVLEMRRNIFGTIWNYFPFYLFSSSWLKAHNAAIGLKMMKETAN